MSLPPVILLHGCGGSPAQAFERTGWIDAFRTAGRDVQALRLPGHGLDGASHDPADYADLARMLAADLPSGACDLVGFSLGAKLALAVAVRYPGRIRRMVLGGIGDNVFAPEAVGEAAANALENGVNDDTPPPVRAFLATWDPALNDPLAVAAILRRLPNPVFTPADIAGIDIPVAVMNGSADFVANMGTQLLDALGVEQQLLPGIGHFDLTEQRQFCEFAIRFLRDGASTKE